MGMSQPAVSNHLHALEERFGVALLSRGRRLKPTPAGEALAEHARRLLEAFEELEKEMARHAKPCGRLMVGASSTPGELLLPRLAAQFSKSYPDVTLGLRIGDTDETVAALLRRDVEVAVVGCEVELPGLENRVIERDELVPVVAASDTLAKKETSSADLAACDFVLREHGSATRRAVEKGLAAAGISPHVVMELGSNAAVAGAVAAGAGIGVVPVRTASAALTVKPLNIRGLSFSRPFVLVTERSRPLSPAAEAFVETCFRKDVR